VEFGASESNSCHFIQFDVGFAVITAKRLEVSLSSGHTIDRRFNWIGQW